MGFVHVEIIGDLAQTLAMIFPLLVIKAYRDFLHVQFAAVGYMKQLICFTIVLL